MKRSKPSKVSEPGRLRGMAYLLRQSRQRIWSGEEEITDERRGHAIAAFSRRDVDVDGVSLFSAETREEELLIVAAYACQKKEGPNKLDLLHLEHSEVERFGVVTPDPGSMALRRVNPLHRLLVWTPEVLKQFVEDLLARRRQTKRYSPSEVTAAVASLEPEDVEEGPHRDWVLKIKLRASASSGPGRA
jgi:hypothetical protein